MASIISSDVRMMQLGRWTVEVNWMLAAWALYALLAFSSERTRVLSTYLGLAIAFIYVWQARRIHRRAVTFQRNTEKMLAEVETIHARAMAIVEDGQKKRRAVTTH